MARNWKKSADYEKYRQHWMAIDANIKRQPYWIHSNYIEYSWSMQTFFHFLVTFTHLYNYRAFMSSQPYSILLTQIALYRIDIVAICRYM